MAAYGKGAWNVSQPKNHRTRSCPEICRLRKWRQLVETRSHLRWLHLDGEAPMTACVR